MPPMKLKPPTSAITSRKPVLLERAMRRDDRRKKRGLGTGVVVDADFVRSCWPKYRANMAKKTIRKAKIRAKGRPPKRIAKGGEKGPRRPRPPR